MAKINPAGRKKVLGYRSIYLKFNWNVVTTKQIFLDEVINERLNYVISMGVLSYSRTQSLQNALQSRWSTRAAAAWPPCEAGSARNCSAVRPQYYHIGPTYFSTWVTFLRNAFFWKFDPHPPPRNANNVEPHTFITPFSGKAYTPTLQCVT